MIHKYKLAGLNILLDVNSGGVHIIDDLTYDILDNVEPPFDEKCPNAVIKKLSKSYKAEDIEECYEEIVELYNDKILFSEDDYEKYALTSVASPIKSMCLHVSHDCNLRCEYCFASTGDFGGGRMLMDLETGKKAIDFLMKMSANRETLELDFFGGEPLMNFEVVKQIVAYAREEEKKYKKKIRFTITTNGMLLTEDKFDFINEEMSNVVLSIDGRKDVNDRVRCRVDGSGSYDRIIENYKKFVPLRGDKDYYVRGTYTKYNLDFSEDVMHLFEQGFEQISVEPVMADPKMPYAISDGDLPKIFKEYEILSEKITKIRNEGRFINFFHFMLDLSGGPCLYKRLSGCGSGTEYLAVTPWGDLYPCHQFVGNEKFLLGNVDEGVKNTDMTDEFKMCNVYAKESCRDCFARFYCSGGCAANSYNFHGNLTDAYKVGCELEKKRVECAIMIKAAMADQ